MALRNKEKLFFDGVNSIANEYAEGKILHYLEDWQCLRFETRNYEIMSAYYFADVKYESIFGNRKSWSPIDSEKISKYREERGAEVIENSQKDGRSIKFRARLQGGDKIHVLEIKDETGNFKEKEEPDDFVAEEVVVQIYPLDEKHPGIIFFFGGEFADKEDIYMNLFISIAQFDKFVAEINAYPNKPKIWVSARALLFEDEVHRALAPPLSSSDYLLPSNKPNAFAILQSVNVSHEFGPAQSSSSQEQGSNVSFIGRVDTPAAPVSERSNMNFQSIVASMTGIKTALYVLAFVIVVSRFIR